MGWLGWTEEQTLQTTVPAIEIAYRGRCDMLQDVIKAAFGGGEDEKPAAPKASPRPLTMKLFDALFSGKRK